MTHYSFIEPHAHPRFFACSSVVFLDYSLFSLFLFSLLSLPFVFFVFFFLSHTVSKAWYLHSHTHSLQTSTILFSCFFLSFIIFLCPVLFPFGSPSLSFPHKHPSHTHFSSYGALTSYVPFFLCLSVKALESMISLRHVLGGFSHSSKGWIQLPTRPEPSISNTYFYCTW